jgi:hypothetical protein
MKATPDILHVWRKFDTFPMETLTKSWYYYQSSDSKQRCVELMEEHRSEYGTSGNCFDLALWLIDAFSKEGILSYAVGHDLKSPNAHVAVVAKNAQGNKYFCDLGDQWINPILIDRDSDDFSEDELEGFVTGGKVKVETDQNELNCWYIRPNGKVSQQKFDLRPMDKNELMDAAIHSQLLLRYPLVEMRIFDTDEVVHWEFDKWSSFISSNKGLINEESLLNNTDWAERINLRTGIHKEIIIRSLEVYSKL